MIRRSSLPGKLLLILPPTMILGVLTEGLLRQAAPTPETLTLRESTEVRALRAVRDDLRAQQSDPALLERLRLALSTPLRFVGRAEDGQADTSANMLADLAGCLEARAHAAEHRGDCAEAQRWMLMGHYLRTAVERSADRDQPLDAALVGALEKRARRAWKNRADAPCGSLLYEVQ